MTPTKQSYREIPLTQGQVALVDAEDYERLSQHNWHAHWSASAKTFYARTNIPTGTRKQTTVLLHRFVMGINEGAVKVDHHDHDGLNCRRYNLRVCTSLQNNQNKRTYSSNKSGYKGVFWRPDSNRWRVMIYLNGEHISLGSYDRLEEAARTYDRKAIELFGEFAHLNFSRSDYDVELTTLTCPE